MSADSVAKVLSAAMCESFGVEQLDDGRWIVHTPLLYADGDALPVFVTETDGAWSLSDEGMATSHLFFDDFEPTKSRLKRMQALVADGGGTYDDERVVRLDLDAPPSPYDVGDFLQLVAQLRGAALVAFGERDEQVRYVTRQRQRVVDALQTPDYEPNWSPPGDPSGLFKADLRVATAPNQPPVALFLASTVAKTGEAALSAVHFNRIHADVQPVLAYDPTRVSSKAVYRFQETVEDDMATVVAPPDDVTQLLPALRQRGVLV